MAGDVRLTPFYDLKVRVAGAGEVRWFGHCHLVWFGHHCLGWLGDNLQYLLW